MIKEYCDKCKKEIIGTRHSMIHMNYQVNDSNHSSWHLGTDVILCMKCGKEMLDSIGEPL